MILINQLVNYLQEIPIAVNKNKKFKNKKFKNEKLMKEIGK